MNLKQLECDLDPTLAEALSADVEEEALSVSWYEKEPDQWVFQAVYNPDQETILREKIEVFFAKKSLYLAPFTTKELPKKDWVEAVYQGFPPLTIGRFYIYGSLVEGTLPTGLIPLQVDAATAFGSGQHESTEGCLKALSLLAEEGEFKHPLDMGCGSGILALAMAALWKVPVFACDNDPEAVRVTLENAQINGFESLIEAEVSEGFTAVQGKTFDLITANILAGPLCQMSGNAAKALMPGGTIVLAGLPNRQAEDVIDAYRSVGTKLVHQLFIGDWSTLIMRKESHG